MVGGGCIRGSLPAREFYRLAPPDSLAVPSRAATPAPLSRSIAVVSYDTPGIYGAGAIVYRVGASQYGAYPSREWAIPLGEMLGGLSDAALRRSGLTSGRVIFDPSSTRREAYVWRGSVREFDEVDGPSVVSASVVLAAELVRAADDSVIWSGVAREGETVGESRSMEVVVGALSAAASRAVARLAADAAAALRHLAAAGAQPR